MFTEIFLDHFKNPRNSGELPPPAISVQVENPACGDILKLWVEFADGVVSQVRYKARGCTASIVAGSALTEWMLGKSRDQLRTLTASRIDEAVGGLIPESKHAAVLCVDGVRRLVSALK